MDFNNQWIEIFKAGDYGDKGKFGVDDLDKMVANFSQWQPPAVLGHPSTDSPAMGWASRIRREGDRLFAQFEKLQPAFVDAVRDGRFPNRSVALYRNPKGSGPAIRHIGFLGATPPEVKGLAPIQFSDGDFVAIDFNESEDVMDQEQVKKTVRESIKEFFGEIFGEKAKPQQFDEAKLSSLVGEAVKSQVTPLQAQITALSEENKALREGTVAAQSTARVGEIRAFVESMKAQGKWVPAMDAILPFVETAAKENRTLEFGEGDKKQTLSALDALKRHASLLGQIVPLNESKAGRVKTASGKVIQFNDGGGSVVLDANSVALNEAAEEIHKANPKMEFGEALKQASREHPELLSRAVAGQA